MATLTLKGVPDELLERLRVRAQMHRRSLNSEALVALEKSLGPARIDPEAFLARIRRDREEMHGTPLTPEMIEKAIAEGRP
ncbi:FitA-like ribbon-helix-helix domain-containing protein [Longimicrobium sp.]|uniref:FitA-like ribbon-helix-helix domain-containing protein n=1 Tax=Longimicrobium sp. TaxID=2029185 RepID=UPI002CE5AD5B|nr:Arc family DNA-binding protein [Longimicrobium sp.]HSU14659.1 Arc family DNA-binding protein [Longimicrobium sp.]